MIKRIRKKPILKTISKYLNNLFILLFLTITLSSPLFSFGKNKIQYKQFDWNILKTPHFDIYYNKSQRTLAEQSAVLLEDACAQLSENLRFELTRIIPVIIYSSHNDFEQSNVIMEMIGEGTGGFTEVFKNRVVVPFTGSYSEYRHVLHHELTHAFQFNILLGGFWESLFTRQFMYMPPLWFMEGVAEQQSIGWDRELDMVLKDATVNNMLIPLAEMENSYSLNGLQVFMLYKEGQGFVQYVVEKYGRYKVGEIFKVFKRTRDFIHSFKKAVGKTHYQVNQEWFRYLRKRYWPLVKDKKEPGEFSKKLTDHLQDSSFYNVKPVWSPDGKKIAILTDRHIFTDIILIDARTGEELDTIVEGGRESSFEEMHTRDNMLSWSHDGKYLIFVSKAGEFDRIHIYDFKEEEVIRSINPRMDAVASPAISSDNKWIAFSGTKNGKNNLYVIQFNGSKMTRLTDDLYSYFYPVFSKDGKYIIFTSNRDKGYLSGDMDIFAMHTQTRKITKIVSSKGQNQSPALSRDGKIMTFSSDRDGTPNLYIKYVDNFEDPEGLLKKKEYKITDVIVGVFDPYFSPDAKKVVFSSFFKLGQDIYVMDVPEEIERMESIENSASLAKLDQPPKTAFDLEEAGKEDYTFSLTPDWVMGGFMYSSVYGFGGFTQIGASDILGDHQFMLATDFLSGVNDFNFQFVYYYLAHRINYGVGVFHFKDYYFDYEYENGGYIFETFYKRRYGLDLLMSYPFTKFFRTDLELLGMRYIRRSEEEELVKNVDTNIYATSLAFVYDTILWGETGPAWGFRSRLIYQRSWPITGKDWIYEMAFLDLRKYFLINKKYTFAFRLQGGSVWGPDRHENKFYLGGYNTIRGHRYDAYSGLRMFLYNMEFRFPFIRRITIVWPFTFNISNLNSVFFWDFGSAWDNTEKWRIGSSNGRYKFQDLKSGLGWGFRLRVIVFQLRLDLATPWDGSKILPLSKWQGLFSLAYDF
ncbi:MAG: PD40 domain-containing protein [Spirochaetes bacterium]|nr:PD40 domain-containing protein [Spirochaetota bacterium]